MEDTFTTFVFSQGREGAEEEEEEEEDTKEREQRYREDSLCIKEKEF